MHLKNILPRKTRLVTLCSVGVMASLLAACSPENQDKNYKKPLNNQFGQAAIQADAKACASLFSVLGQSATANSRFSARIIPDSQDSNKHGITGIIGQTYGSGDAMTKGTGTVYAAPVNGKCEGVMVRTLYMKQSCIDVAKKQLPPKTERKQDLTQTAVFSTPEGANVTMIPTGESACIVTMTLNLKDQD